MFGSEVSRAGRAARPGACRAACSASAIRAPPPAPRSAAPCPPAAAPRYRRATLTISSPQPARRRRPPSPRHRPAASTAVIDGCRDGRHQRAQRDVAGPPHDERHQRRRPPPRERRDDQHAAARRVATPRPPRKPMKADQLWPTTAATPAAAATHSGEPGGPATYRALREQHRHGPLRHVQQEHRPPPSASPRCAACWWRRCAASRAGAGRRRRPAVRPACRTGWRR